MLWGEVVAPCMCFLLPAVSLSMCNPQGLQECLQSSMQCSLSAGQPCRGSCSRHNVYKSPTMLPEQLKHIPSKVRKTGGRLTGI